MKATGIVRRIDSLGRIVIPREIRKAMRIKEGDPIEIYTDQKGQIVLAKYSPLGELENCCGEYVESMAHVTGKLVIITDTEKVLAAAGSGKRTFKDKYLGNEARKIVAGRKEYLIEDDGKKAVPIFSDQKEEYQSQIIRPILAEGDVIGSIILMGRVGEDLTETDRKLIECAADFFGRQME